MQLSIVDVASTFQRNHVFSYVHNTHASVMARVRNLLIQPQTTCVFRFL